MDLRAAVTSLSWIPSETVTGLAKRAFESGVTHYDAPPPERLGDLDHLQALGAQDTFRFANRLAVRVTSSGGEITAAEYSGESQGVMGGTTLQMGPWRTRMAAVTLPLRRAAPDIRGGRVHFRQTFGGRAALPAPRRVDHPPYVQVRAPLVWTTLELVVHADGTVAHSLAGASAFPRHWVYDPDGALALKSGTADFDSWYRTSFGEHTPWGDQDSPALVSEVETALEREVSTVIMRGGERPAVRQLPEGTELTRQGEAGAELYLLLDGVLAVTVDGAELGLLGPGAVVGERALLEGGHRTATLTARTPTRVAVAREGAVDLDALQAISTGHRREERGSE